ncbi:MAG TPA: hypothetical protein VN622_08375 [Clostridia bacterium]|nr:hypothetical protein [Clostridia bacterium]
MGEGQVCKPAGMACQVEYSSAHKLRVRNKLYYRLAHWPIWIVVFYLVPGPMTFNLFAHGADRAMGYWLAIVVVGTALSGLFGKLPGVEPRPYILRFTEDRPNPLYRRICYTLAWSELITYAVLNICGLAGAIVIGKWRLQQIYAVGYLPMVASLWLLGFWGRLPRVKASTKGEGDERRYFYGAVWSVPVAHAALWLLWVALPQSRFTDVLMLTAFIAVIVVIGSLARRGVLPRTRKILPGELAVSD